MKLSELMANHTPNPAYTGFITQDDMVLAVDCSTGTAAEQTDAADFAVVQLGISGVDSSMNPTSVDSTYLRTGTSTTKTGTQRSFKITGDRYVGDEFQDFALSAAVKYGTGADVVRSYIYFNVRTGLGERGTVSILVNSDAAGTAGNNATIDIELKSVGVAPVEYSYAAAAEAADEPENTDEPAA